MLASGCQSLRGEGVIRLLYVESQVAEADNEVEARAELASRPIPDGLVLLGEKKIGEERTTIGAIAETTELAYSQIKQSLGEGWRVGAERILSRPGKTVFNVIASDEDAALEKVRSVSREDFFARFRTSIGGIETEHCLVELGSPRLTNRGSSGLFGLGKSDRRYEVEVTRVAALEADCYARSKMMRSVGAELTSLIRLQQCMRRDNLDPNSDFRAAREQLAVEGPRAALGLAMLIETCVQDRAAGTVWAVAAARHAAPSRRLREAVSGAVSASATCRAESGANYLEAELVGTGGQTIGWSDATHGRLRGEGNEVLAAMPEDMEADAEPPGRIIKACASCNDPVSFKLDGELLCARHYHERQK